MEITKFTGCACWIKTFFGLLIALLFSITSYAQTSITYHYNDLNQLVALVRSDAHQITYRYDDVFNVQVKEGFYNADNDNDQLENSIDPDDDNDGLPDIWELRYGLNPFDPTDADLDSDGDGVPNIDEYRKGFSPLVENPVDINVPVLPVYASLLLFIVLGVVGNLALARRHGTRALASVSFLTILSATLFSENTDAQALPEGWHNSTAELVTPEQSQTLLKARAEKLSQASFVSLGENQQQTQPRSSAAITAAPLSEFAVLVRALDSNPIKIYQHVLNTIEYTPYYGYLKGAKLTLIEQSGNDFDQAALLVALLREAGYEAQFRYGSMTIPLNVSNDYDMESWLGLLPTASNVASALASGGIPVSNYNSANVSFDRAWVQLEINGQSHQLDPAFKRYKKIQGGDLQTMAGYSSADLLAAAAGTEEGNAIHSLDYDQLASKLTQLSAQLGRYINDQAFNLKTEQLIGGREIIPQNVTTLPVTTRFAVSNVQTWQEIPQQYMHTLNLNDGKINATFNVPELEGQKIALRYGLDADFVSSTPNVSSSKINFGTVNPSDIPKVYQDIMSIGGVGASYATYTGDSGMGMVGGNSLTTPPCGGVGGCIRSADINFQITSATSGTKSGVLRTDEPRLFGRYIRNYDVSVTIGKAISVLYIDDQVIQTHGISLAATSLPKLSVTIDHPYAANEGTYGDQTASYDIKFNSTYALITLFGSSNTGELLRRRQMQLNTVINDALPNDSHRLVSETLNVIGHTWMRQTELTNQLLGNISNVASYYHHRIGVVAQEKGFYIDVPQQQSSNYSRDSGSDQKHFLVRNLFASAFEHGTLEQLQKGNLQATSTIRLLKLANDSGQKIFDVNADNISEILPHLVNYSSTDKQKFTSAANDHAARLILPEDSNIRLRQWTGAGYIDYRQHATGQSLSMIIDGDYMGGYAATEVPVNTSWVAAELAPEIQLPAQIPRTLVSDPVDLATGAFVSDLTDLQFGAGGTQGVAFTRSYDSRQSALDTAGLGKGWTHNYNIRAQEHSDVVSGLGGRQPRDAVALLIAAYATLDLMREPEPALRNWVTAALIANWAMDQLLNNAVSVTRGSQVTTFIKQPDGAFSPPPASTLSIIDSEAGYEVKERFGDTYFLSSFGPGYKIIDPNGNEMKLNYSGSVPIKITDSLGRALTFDYILSDGSRHVAKVTDFSGREVQYSYVNGQLVEVRGLNGATWRYSYDTNNQLLTTIDPEGNTIVNNHYDELGRVVEQQSPRTTGSATYNMYYAPDFSVEVDPSGERTTYYYDKHRRAIAVQDALGNTIHNEYDGQGQLAQTTDALGNITRYEYSSDNNLTKITNADGESSKNYYDEKLRLARTSNALGHSQWFFYDEKDQRIKTQNNLFEETHTAYRNDGLVDWLMNSKRIKTVYGYDEYGHPSTHAVGDHPPVNTQYDELGRLTEITDQIGATTEFTHDERGFVTTRKDALGNETLISYNRRGAVTSQTDRNDDTSTISYTPTGKISSVNYPEHEGALFGVVSPAFTVSYSYDSHDRLSAMTDQHGSTQNTYDTLNRLTGHTDPNGHTVGYQYDANSNITQISYPDGNTVSYHYDALNRIAQVSINALSSNALFSYDAASRLTDITHFNNAQTRYHYDTASRLLGLNHQNANGETLIGYEYTLDVTGNRIHEEITSIPLSLPRPSGILFEKTFNAEHNRIQHIGEREPIDFIYDTEGQLEILLNEYFDSSFYSYDAAHRVVLLSEGSRLEFYKYDGAGNRIWAKRNGAETQYVYDAGGNLLAETNANGDIQKYFIYGPTGLLAMVDAATNETYVYHFDGTGHTVAMTNSAGEIVNRYAYSPYGVLLREEETVPQPFTYAGQVGVYTEASNVYYMRARYYNAELTQFISEDPSGFIDGPNLYAYVGGNPIGYVDPTGEFVCGGLCIAGIGIGAGIAFDFAIDAIRGSGNSGMTAGNAALGAGVALTLDTQIKPRTGIAGGGPSGDRTSVASQINHGASKRGLYSTPARHLITKGLRKLPYVGSAVGAYQLGDAIYDRYNNTSQISNASNIGNGGFGSSGK